MVLQGKQDQWSQAHAKTQEASKHANASELAACRAQEKYSSMSEAQRNADNARRRQQEVMLFALESVLCGSSCNNDSIPGTLIVCLMSVISS